MVPTNASLIAASGVSPTSPSGMDGRWQAMATRRGELEGGEDATTESGDFSLVIGAFFAQLDASANATVDSSSTPDTLAVNPETVETLESGMETPTAWLDAWHGGPPSQLDPTAWESNEGEVVETAVPADPLGGSEAVSVYSSDGIGKDAEQLAAMDGADASMHDEQTGLERREQPSLSTRSITAAIGDAMASAAQEAGVGGKEPMADALTPELQVAVASANASKIRDPFGMDGPDPNSPENLISNSTRQDALLSNDGPDLLEEQHVETAQVPVDADDAEVVMSSPLEDSASPPQPRSFSAEFEDVTEGLEIDLAEPASVTESNSASGSTIPADVSATTGTGSASIRQVATPAATQLADRIQMTLVQEPDLPARVEVELDPPELGKVTVELTDRDGGISARIHAARETTGVLLDQQMNHLKQILQDAGVNVMEFQVTYDFGQSANEAFQQDRHFADRWSRRAFMGAEIDDRSVDAPIATSTRRSQLDIRV